MQFRSVAAGLALFALPALAHAEGPAPTVQLSKVLLDTENANTQGNVKGGTMCVSSERFSWGGGGMTALDYEQYDNVFNQTASAGGYAVISKTANLFAEATEIQADYLIGATMLPRIANICLTNGGRIKGTVESDIEFQLFDNKTKTVVYKTTTHGVSTIEKFARDESFSSMLRASFGDALKSFLAAPEVRGAANPAAAAPASS